MKYERSLFKNDPFCTSKNQLLLFQKLAGSFKGRVHSKKKKLLWIFTTGGGGVRTKFCHFHNFLFFFHTCSESSKFPKKIFFKGGGYPTWPLRHRKSPEFLINLFYFSVFKGIFFSSASMLVTTIISSFLVNFEKNLQKSQKRNISFSSSSRHKTSKHFILV